MTSRTVDGSRVTLADPSPMRRRWASATKVSRRSRFSGRARASATLVRSASADDGVAARSFRNLPSVQVIMARELIAYDVLVNDYVVFTQATLPSSAAKAATEEEGA